MTSSANDEAYQRLVAAMANRDVESGSVVALADLEQLLNLPVALVRDAVERVEQDGRLERLADDRCRIFGPEMADVRHTFLVRIMIERQCVQDYAEHCPPEELSDWQRRHDDYEASIEEGGSLKEVGRSMGVMDNDFHFGMVDRLKNPVLSEIYREIRERLSRNRLDHYYMITWSMHRDTIAEHRPILAAIAARDGAAAADAMERHLRTAMRRAMGL